MYIKKRKEKQNEENNYVKRKFDYIARMKERILVMMNEK